MGLFDSLLSQPQPVGYGPLQLLPPLPKAQNNVTAMSPPAPSVPHFDPATMVNALVNASEAPSQTELLRQQASLAGLNTVAAAQRIKFLSQLSNMLGPDAPKAANGDAGSEDETPDGTARSSATASMARTPRGKPLADDDTNWWKSIEGSANFAKDSGIFGDPTQDGWAANNLTTIQAPGGANVQVNKLAAPSFQGFLGDLAAEGYPINSVGGYNLRNIRGGQALSEHAYGNAIDINPADNPMQGTLKTNLPNNVADLAAKWGLSWGGDWQSRKDPMHFEWAGVDPAHGIDYRSGKPMPLVQLAQATPQVTNDAGSAAPAGISPTLSPQQRFAAQIAPRQQPVTGNGNPSGGTAPAPLVPGIDPQRLLQLGLYGQLAGMPNVAAPFETYYYNSPQYKAAIESATKAADLPYVGPAAAAAARAKLTNTPLLLRSGSTAWMVGPDGQFHLVAQSPRLPEGTSLTNSPSGPIAETVPGAIDAIQKASQATTAGKAAVETNPNAFAIKPPPGSGPGLDKPQPMPDGSVVPPVNAAAPIVGGATSLDEQQKDWNERANDWGKTQVALQTAIQRTQMIGSAMQAYQTGAYANELSELRAGLKTAGINIPDSIAGDPAQAQIILKNAFKATLDTLQTAHLNRATQMEVRLSLENFANPNLQPAANLAILGQTLGQLQWEQSKIQGWAAAKTNGWRDPNDYERAWIQQPQNGLQGFVDRAERSIGPLKGMSGEGAVPAPPIAHNPATGHEIIQKNGQWVDRVTGQPLAWGQAPLR